MANIKSARKRIQVNAVKRARNASAKSRLKTFIRKYRAAIDQGNTEAAAQLYRQVSSLLDKAAAKGIIHKNAASRHKSRLAAKM